MDSIKFILNRIYTWVKKDSRIFIIIIKIALLITGTIILGVIVFRLWPFIWAYISDVLTMILCLVFLVAGLFSFEISDFLQDWQRQKNSARADFNNSIILAVFTAVCDAAFYFHYNKPSSLEDLNFRQCGSRWHFSLYIPSTILNDISNNLHDMYNLVQHRLDSLQSSSGELAIVEAIHTNQRNGELLIIVRIVNKSTHDAIARKWASMTKDSANSYSSSDFYDDDF